MIKTISTAPTAETPRTQCTPEKFRLALMSPIQPTSQIVLSSTIHQTYRFPQTFRTRKTAITVQMSTAVGSCSTAPTAQTLKTPPRA